MFNFECRFTMLDLHALLILPYLDVFLEIGNIGLQTPVLYIYIYIYIYIYYLHMKGGKEDFGLMHLQGFLKSKLGFCNFTPCVLDVR